MNCQARELIEGPIGRVEDMEVQEDDMGWGNYLVLRIDCDLRKVIAKVGL